jgi:hypothetical protein
MIVRIFSFVRLLKSSKHLKSHIFAISFGDSEEYGETVQEIINELKDWIQYLHLRPLKMVSIDSMPLTLTSLELDTDVLGLDYPSVNVFNWEKGDRPTWSVDRKLFYAFFTLPHLTSLSVADIRGWDWIQGDKSEFTGKINTSNITCIKFLGSAPAGNDLSTILSWPKALKSYHHEVDLDENQGYSCGNEFVWT